MTGRHIEFGNFAALSMRSVKRLATMQELWKFAVSIRTKVLKFNGNLFADAKVLPLGAEEIGELYEAAQKDWQEVEPAIFGTLLEQALDPVERKRLGAHYTPRAYVERLVVATIVEPLREDWRNVQATAETKRVTGDLKGPAAEVKNFHDKLCEDPRSRSGLWNRELPLCVVGIDETSRRRGG
jgi:hypothetical protein